MTSGALSLSLRATTPKEVPTARAFDFEVGLKLNASVHSIGEPFWGLSVRLALNNDFRLTVRRRPSGLGNKKRAGEIIEKKRSEDEEEEEEDDKERVFKKRSGRKEPKKEEEM